jgi:ribosome-interacting GTPase 1
MPANVTLYFQKAQLDYLRAKTNEERLAALKKMLSLAPGHKGGENLRANIRRRIAKLKGFIEKEKRQRKGKGFQIAVKKEGSAQICLVGTTRSGKSILLNKLTNANAETSEYPFTTKMPQVGTFDYKGVKLQIVEIPAIRENFEETEHGLAFLGIMRQADLLILLFKDEKEKRMIENLLEREGISMPRIIYKGQENLGGEIWKNLRLVKIYTKQPHRKTDPEPLVLKKGSTIKDMAEHVHKDFVRRFKFARVYGKSVKFDGIKVGINHALEDDDIVELHMS